MNLLVFDLDGTLTKTNAVDDACFAQAFTDALGIRRINTNWEEYEHVSDLGCFRQVFEENFNRAPALSETAKFVECFLGLLKERHAADAGLFSEIPGAGSLVENFRKHSEWRVAIATGCWEASAKFKLLA